MSVFFKPGETITSDSGVTYTVTKFIGSGGQGEVYEVTGPSEKKALKMLNGRASTDRQKKIIADLVADGAPSENFLWPEDIISSRNDGTFGYVMRLRPREYKGIPDLFNQKVTPDTKTLIKVIYNMANEYELLHQRGYSYKDINEKNIFFNPGTGDVLICDNDNVSVNGENDSGVDGTMRFMAPEIVRNEARPSRNTDLYSLAVLMFMILYVSHPLEGKNEYRIHSLDANAQRGLYGVRPIYIFDPNNRENEPVPGYHTNAIAFRDYYPEFLKKKFESAFTTGLINPSGRIVEREWKKVSVQLLDSLIRCPSCGVEMFYDDAKIRQGGSVDCWNCQKKIPKMRTITINRNTILLYPKNTVKAHHLSGNFDFDTVIGTIVTKPNDPSVLGLRNESSETWTYTRVDGSPVRISTNQSAALNEGASIDFGNIKCEI